jgi:hypothetical protein
VLWTLCTAPTRAQSVVQPAGVGRGAPVELGVRFSVDVPGAITAIRFWKPSGEPGPHQVSLWDAAGKRLAVAGTTRETESGWQSAALAAPVLLAPGATYTASWHSGGGFGYSLGDLAAGVDSAPLHVPAGGSGYMYGPGGLYPGYSYQAANYWIDVDFAPLAPGVAIWRIAPLPVPTLDAGAVTVQVAP